MEVYVYTFPNGKKYVGQTIYNWQIRAGKGGKRYKGCPALYQAIKEFGWDSKTVQVFSCDNIEQLNIKEKELIKLYSSNDINFGYNLTDGGTYSGHQKTSLAVCQYDLQGNFIDVYDSIRDASFITNIDRKSISNCCKRQFLTAGGFIWRYFEEDLTQEEILQEIKNIGETKVQRAAHRTHYGEAVLMIDANTNIVLGRYKNTREAAKETHHGRAAITKSCNTGVCINHTNHRFVYEGDYIPTAPLQLQIKYHNKNIQPLFRADPTSWIDLRAAETVSFKAGERKLISLGISIKMPYGYEALVAPRSSLFKNTGLLMANELGIIDNLYQGNDDIWMFNALATKDITINEGDRICQFRIIETQPSKEHLIFKEVDCLEANNRSGFGSTGKN